MDYAAAVTAVETYMTGLAGDDVTVILNLYAEDARIEDPIGSEVITGHEAIRTFYTFALQAVKEAKLTGPVRLAANEAAFSFTLRLGEEDSATFMDIIDVFTFNDEGKVSLMRAFWGPENTRSA